jgi:hypothetical protein
MCAYHFNYILKLFSYIKSYFLPGIAICVEHTFWLSNNTNGKIKSNTLKQKEFLKPMLSSLSLYQQSLQQSNIAATVKHAILEAFKDDFNLLSHLKSAEDYPHISKQLETIVLNNLMRRLPTLLFKLLL